MSETEEQQQHAPSGPTAVKDVPAEQFIQAYAAHLKTNDKVYCNPATRLYVAAVFGMVRS